MNHTNGDERDASEMIQGNPEVFASLVGEHYGAVYAVAFSTVGNWSAAQDIAQETFLLAWSQRKALRNLLAFPAWVRRIAGNLAKNWLRSADYRRRLAVHYSAETGSETMPHSGPDAVTAARFRRAEVWCALEELPPNVREVVVMYYLRGEKLRAVAAALGISENAAKKRLQYGRTKLRVHFEEQWKAEMARADAFDGSHSARERFLAGLAAGPAVSSLGETAAHFGLGLWWETTKLGALCHSALPGVAIMSAKKVAVITAGVVVCIGTFWAANHVRGAGVTSQGSKQGTNALPTPVKSPESVPPPNPPGGNATVQVAGGHATRQKPAAALPAQPKSSGTPQKKIAAAPNKVVDPRDYASVEGIVVDEQNVPIRDATLTLVASGMAGATGKEEPEEIVALKNGYQRSFVDRAQHWTSTTDDSGAFSITDVSFPGVALLVARAAGYSSTSETINIEPASQTTDIIIKMMPGITVYGRLLSEDGAPVTDGALRIAGFSNGSSGRGMSNLYTFTDDSGGFELGVESAGVVSILAESPACGSATFANVIVEPEKTLELRYPAPAVVYGRVTDPLGAPATGVRVQLSGFVVTQVAGSGSSTRCQGSTYSVAVDVDGRFRFDDVDASQEYASAVLGEDGSVMVEGKRVTGLEPGAEFELNLTVRAQMTVKGTVYGAATGRPLEGISVEARPMTPLGDAPHPGSAAQTRTVTGADGSYTLAIMTEPGTYQVTGTCMKGYGLSGGALPPAVSTVELESGETATVDLRVVEPLTRTFVVVDGSGVPVEGASAAIQLRSDQATVSYGFSKSTDAAGGLTVSMIPPGFETTVKFHKTGFLEAASAAVTGYGGEAYSEETIVMYQRAGIAATLIDGEGAPLADRDVIIVVGYGDQPELRVPARTDANGVLTVASELPATEASLEFQTTQERNGAMDPIAIRISPATLRAGEVENLGQLAAPAKTR